MFLKDNIGRVHDYLRISLTDKCNLRCTYCRPTEKICSHPAKQLLSDEEIIDIASTFVKEFGINKIRFTGGEPLVRKNAGRIIESISQLSIEPGGKQVELAITTNGILLDKFLPLFAKIGLLSINVSLDSLIAERFYNITKRPVFEIVKKNIELAIKKGFNIKINTVAMRAINDDEIIDFIEWTRNYPIHVRFIEFMPFDGNKWQGNRVLTYKEILSMIKMVYPVKKLNDKPNSTSKSYKVDGFKGTFAVISSVTSPFCDSCNRIRLTADGKIKNCLFSNNELDLLTPLRTSEDIKPLIKKAILNKKQKHGGLPEFHDRKKLLSSLSFRNMMEIGG